MADIGDILDNTGQHSLEIPVTLWYASRCWKCQRNDSNERYAGLCAGCALWLDEEEPAPEPEQPRLDNWLLHVDLIGFHIMWQATPDA